ncbi:MAG: DUF485 domain-containing protein [Bacteriovoracaceae bacterium]|nr:DUF485 domain-containing protein [Bacteriovoracaceae bacterium]
MHGPAVELAEDKASDAKSKLGVYLFIVYSLVYAGFVIINTVSPKLMGIEMFMGLNLAVVYGFGLIILAIVMGLIYNHICTKMEDEMNKEQGDKQ